MKKEQNTPTSDQHPALKGENICRPSESKVCIGCLQSKLKVEFNSKQSRCKVCQSVYKSHYYVKNKLHINGKSKAWRAANPEQNRKMIKAWETANKEYVRACKNRYAKEYKKTNPEAKVVFNIRRRLNDVLKGRKHKKTLELLGCSLMELKLYIEAKWTVGMTWENYGPAGWHIDHIFPLSKANLLDPKEVERVCHYTNLQPLWALDNCRKSNKLL